MGGIPPDPSMSYELVWNELFCSPEQTRPHLPSGKSTARFDRVSCGRAVQPEASPTCYAAVSFRLLSAKILNVA
jgi:hypothetical protein